MQNKIVYDASVLIMLFAKEPGYEKARKHIKNGIISSVNVAEIYKYCMDVQNLSENDCKQLLKISGIKIIDFCEEQALISAKILKKTKIYGLSFGDRACIALAMMKNYSIFTCNKIWQKIDIGIDVVMAR